MYSITMNCIRLFKKWDPALQWRTPGRKKQSRCKLSSLRHAKAVDPTQRKGQLPAAGTQTQQPPKALCTGGALKGPQ